MDFDFDEPVDRRGTHSLKWDKYKGQDIVPLWVADMDFRVAPAISMALHAHVDHGIFGYTVVPDELIESVVERMAGQYHWGISPEWIVWLPGLVTGINVACRAVGDTGDAVLTTVPIYPPFLSAPGFSSRELFTVHMVEKDDRWQFDFDLLERAITPRTRLLLLCSPHNPCGRVFTRDELALLAEICVRHDLIICSDEIHCELVLDADTPHIPTAALSPEVAQRTITLMAPSKTFNIPGLGCSFAVISDKTLRAQFTKAMQGIVPHVNALGYTAALAAYRDSAQWHLALLDYLRKNRDIVERFIGMTPGISMHHVEATYLAWIDTRETGMKNPAEAFENAGVGLSDGKDFGSKGFIRLNFGCRQALLEEALQRMRRVIIAT
jgi:cystathionine beta-lyase